MFFLLRHLQNIGARLAIQPYLEVLREKIYSGKPAASFEPFLDLRGCRVVQLVNLRLQSHLSLVVSSNGFVSSADKRSDSRRGSLSLSLWINLNARAFLIKRLTFWRNPTHVLA